MPQTGELTDSRDLPWYVTALLVSQPLHFGDYGGMPLKILWALLDIVTIVVLGSGLYLWLHGRVRSASEAAAPHGAADIITTFARRAAKPRRDLSGAGDPCGAQSRGLVSRCSAEFGTSCRGLTLLGTCQCPPALSASRTGVSGRQPAAPFCAKVSLPLFSQAPATARLA